MSESWHDGRPGWMDRLSAPVMGVKDRAEHNRKGMQATLESLRRFAEGPGDDAGPGGAEGP